MLTVTEAIHELLNEHKGSEVVAAFDFPDKYVFSIKPIDLPKDVVLMDPFFSVNKDTGKIEEFTPLLDLEGWRKASKNPINLK